MDDFNIEDIPKIDIPPIDVPITHDVPKTTIESLTQIKNEFNTKLQEAIDKNDSSKKRRYERQIKQFNDAIKATTEGKTYNYAELPVPPGFAKIPLKADGRPILGGPYEAAPNRTSVQAVSQGAAAAPRPAPAPPRPTSNASAAAAPHHTNHEEASDDLLEQLENEIDGDHDLGDEENDPELDRINKQLKSLMPNLKKMAPPPDDMMDDNLDENLEILMINNDKRDSKIPKQNEPPMKRQSKVPEKLPQINVNPFPAVQPPRAGSAASAKKPVSKELTILMERQHLFKEAALQAKKDGNTNVALVYLRHSKGFDSMILAAQNGLPVDMNNLPVPPQLSADKKLSPNKSPTSAASSNSPNRQLNSQQQSASKLPDTDEPIPGDRKAVYKRLLEDLTDQYRVAMRHNKSYTSLGDVNNAKKFEQIARESVRDLDSLKSAFEHNEPIPLYHYERRSYQTIDCNPDLTDNDLEITIIRAINLPLPKDFEPKHLTTYVKFEFPYPPETIQSDKTAKQTGTCNPEFNQTFKIQIQRKQSKFVRLMNRKDLKLEIYYKAGLLKGDKLLATGSVKLQQLENSSTIHDAFDLLEGRKQTGGKIECKIRIREPLLHKQVETTELKWLIIDKYHSNSVVL